MIAVENKNQLTDLKKLCKDYNIRICKIPTKKEKFPVYYSVVEIGETGIVILAPDFNYKGLVKLGWQKMEYKEFKKSFLLEVLNA